MRNKHGCNRKDRRLADLVQQTTKVELAVNFKTAKKLGAPRGGPAKVIE